jgi:UDP-3-O-[3-hydroxymyristoyl] N-acetylglucosamine deacetylase/3-hydroxyacyl-[acyl-carrier-protein] dehydratase
MVDAGIVEHGGDLLVFKIEEEFTFLDEESGSEYIVIPQETLEITTLLDFPGTALSFQYGNMKGLQKYPEEIAPSRTFVFVSDLVELASKELIKGGDLSNALVILDQELDDGQVEEIATKIGKEPVDLKNQKSFFDNEPARHKILDIIGDIALTGLSLKAKIIAKKPGHKGNIAFAKAIKKKYLEYKKTMGRPKYDPNIPPIVDTEGVKAMLPHRYPFLLVDKIIELTETRVVGVKNITFNEGFFQGHFPGNPVFPGVLQMEALAQTGGILALSNVEVPSLWDTYFLKMDKVKFKRKVVPGDTLILKMELLTPIRRGIVHMMGTAYVGNNIVSEGELIAQIIKRQA